LLPLLALAALGWFAWPTVRVIGNAVRSYPDYSHGALVPLLALVLVWVRRRELQRRAGGIRWPGIPLATAGVLLALAGFWYRIALWPGALGYVFLQGVGAVLMLGGTLWALLGSGRFRVLAISVAFLLFAVPLPESVMTAATAPLRTVAVVLTTAILRAGGIPVVREGNILELAKGCVGVTDACSGVRSVSVLLVFAVFMSALMRLSVARVFGLLVAVPAMAVAANLIRIVFSAWAVASGRPGLAEGRIHDAVGMVTEAIAAVAIVGFAVAIGRSQKPAASPGGIGAGGGKEPESPPARAGGWAVPAVVCLLVAAGIGARSYIENHYRPFGRNAPILEPRRSLAELPPSLSAGWQVKVLELTPHEIAALKPDDRLLASFENPAGITVYLRVLYWHPQRVRPMDYERFLAPHSPDWCQPTAGWISDKPYEQERVFEWSDKRPVSVRIFRRSEQGLLMFFWQEFGPSDKRWFVPLALRDRLKALMRSWSVPPEARRPARYGVAVWCEYRGDLDATKPVLEAFCRQLVPLLPAHGIGGGTANP